MEIWKVASLFFGLGAFILLTLLWVGGKAAELLRTLKRIEARMTLTNPLEEERKILDWEMGDITTRSKIMDRAFHQDIWLYQYVTAITDLRGKEYREAIEQWRWREKTRRD